MNFSSIILLTNFRDCNSLASLITFSINLGEFLIVLCFRSNLTPKKVISVVGMELDFSWLMEKPNDSNNSKDLLRSCVNCSFVFANNKKSSI